MKKFDGILFDVDGTLTSTFELIYDSFNYITSKYMNKKLSREEVINLFGPTEDVILKDWFPENFDKVQKEYYKFYRDEHHNASIYPGIEEILKFIKSKNVHLGIFTGKGRKTTLITLGALNLVNYFDLIVTGDDVKNHKPSGEGIVKFIKKFNLDKEKVLMIGDSTGDINAARDAGVKIASALWDSYGRDEVLMLESDFVFHKVEELNEFLNMNL